MRKKRSWNRNLSCEFLEDRRLLTGDFNNDGQWDCLDIDALVAEIAAGTNNPLFDLNGDAVVTLQDVTDPATGWLKVGGANNPVATAGFPFLVGDANLDGNVDGSDFGTWNTNKFTNTAAWCAGEFDASGAVDGSDFNSWNGMKFQTAAVAIDTSFVIEAQHPVRNSPDTIDGMADAQDGAYVNLANGSFHWQVEVLPTVVGRNGLTPDWTLRTNSRDYSSGGWFGTTPATLESFERMRRGPNGELIYQEKYLRQFTFDIGNPRSSDGATARSRYEIVKETDAEIILRRADGTRLTFFPIDGSRISGAIRTVQNRFGDTMDYQYDTAGRLQHVVGVRGRVWTFAYGPGSTLTEIREDATTLRDRSVRFSYDSADRLIRIDTTAVINVGMTNNAFANGKPYVLTYAAPTGDLALDTNIESVIYPNEVIDSSNIPRITNAYDASTDRLASQVWGGTNASGIAAGGTVQFAYTPSATTVTDRNGNETVHTFNAEGWRRR